MLKEVLICKENNTAQKPTLGKALKEYVKVKWKYLFLSDLIYKLV